MRKRKDDLQHQYRAAVNEAARHYRIGMNSLDAGSRAARSRYRRDMAASNGSRNGGVPVAGILAIAAVAGAAAVAAAPHIRRLLDEQAGKGEGAADVGASITIDCSADELYKRWRSFEDFDQFMPDVIRVETFGDGSQSEWTVRGPGGKELSFHSRITADEPGRVIAWESDEQPASHKGRVTFQEQGEQTEVRLELHLQPPGGALGAAIGRLIGKTTGSDPKQQAERALRRFKRLMESEASPGVPDDHQEPAYTGAGNGFGTTGAQSI